MATPLVVSSALARLQSAGALVGTSEKVGAAAAVAAAHQYELKLETAQPTRSFKDRGMSQLIRHHRGVNNASRIVCSSGGNAGLAAANAARALGMDAVVVVPKTTKPLMLEKIRDVGARVQVHGDNWNEADLVARGLCEENPATAYVPPFDHPVLWQGHSSLVDELVQQRGKRAPDAIVASVGGGGLLAGILYGLKVHGGDWSKTKVIAVETEGAASMHAALAVGKPVPIQAITSIATSLGALQVSKDAVALSLAHPGGVESVLVSDKQAVAGCCLLADHHGLLVEPSCGASVAGAAMRGSKQALEQDIVVVVCGGSAITTDMLTDMKKSFCVAL